MLEAAFKSIDETARVLAGVEKATPKALSQAAFAIRKTAIASIEVAPGPSQPGKPPHSRRGQLQRATLYDVDRAAGVAVIGPEASIVGTSAEPEEFGGAYKKQHYPERPFMGPALTANLDLIPAGFTGVVTN
jgi:hypothetical protein